MSGPVKLDHPNFVFGVYAPPAIVKKVRVQKAPRVVIFRNRETTLLTALNEPATEWLMANAKGYWTLSSLTANGVIGGDQPAVLFEHDRDALMFFMFADSFEEK